jgi:hypothetical protein
LRDGKIKCGKLLGLCAWAQNAVLNRAFALQKAVNAKSGTADRRGERSVNARHGYRTINATADR